MATLRAPVGLGVKGRKLWREITGGHELPPAELVLLEESCRIADRLDQLDAMLRDPQQRWLKPRVFSSDDGSEVTVIVTIDSALSEARQQANVLKQLLVSLRLPDAATGAKPQQRGARGAYRTGAKAPAGKGGTVSALDRARAARAAGA